MANVLIYNTSNNRATQYLKSVDTPIYLGRDDVLINPDVAPLAAVPFKWWQVDAGAVREMTQAEKDALAAEEAAAAAQAAIDALAQLKQQALDYYNADQDALQRALKAAVWTVLELTVTQLNTLRALHSLAALDANTVKTAFWNSYSTKINSIT